jgi:hypothetical protein|uniref:Uncharacterized protein n=2 Tax=unclassified Caudoviricetes TaxID=2788787 RepID=A0A8S5MX45_9CAUD|nr:MAG TPA: hypothetical protein [Siphoviridae sp. ctsBB38]DAF99152.1 MAG TPA: hypothetical protein [Siphoviridae sp. ctOxh11]
MSKNTIIADAVTMGGITACTVIAGFSLPISLGIIIATALGCGYLTYKEEK